MTDSQMPDKVSLEAHERVKGERDALKAQLDQATNALTDMKLVSEAQGYFTNKVSDPVTAAEMVLPKIRQAQSPEDRQAALEASVPLFAPVQGIVSESPPTEPSVAADGVAPEPPPTPAFMRPNPASEGPTPEVPKLSMRSPEVKQLIESGPEGQDRVRKMMAEGEIEMHPANRSAQALQR